MAELDPVESLDSLTYYCPLPYRVSNLIILGVWLFGLDLHGLSRLKIVRILTSQHSVH